MENPFSHVPDNILSRLKKLMERRDAGTGAITTQAEMEQIQAQIAKITMEYNLELEGLSLSAVDTRKTIEHTKIDINGKQTRHEAGWVNDLYSVIAKHNMCKAVKDDHASRDKDWMGYVWLIGKRHNVEIVEYIVDQLIVKIRMLWKETFRTYQGPEKRNTHRRGFFRGAVHGINIKLAESFADIISQLPDTGKLSVMLRNNNQQILDYCHTQLGFGIKPGGKSSGLKGMGGYESGKQAGQGIAINAGLKSSSSATKYLN